MSESPEQSSLGEVSGRRSFGQSLAMGYLRIVDGSIPAEMRSDASMLRRARTILGFALVLIPLGLETVIFFSWTLPPESALQISAALVVALLLTLAVPRSFRQTHSTIAGGQLILTASYTVITMSLAIMGGAQGPLLHWLGILPLMAGLMCSRAAARRWALVSMSTFGFFVLADAMGWHMQGEFLMELSGLTLWVQRAFDVGSWLAVLLVCTLLYESHTQQQTTELIAANNELESEISQRRDAEERTYYLAHYDELTNLPNRRLFNLLLARAEQNVRRDGRSVGILFLDLDGFKSVNDTHGHSEGDLLLKEVARRLQASLRLCDSIVRGSENTEFVSRLGGDEFTILLEGLRNHREAATVARRILNAFRSPIRLSDREVRISASIGIALQTARRESGEELLRRADLAMYHAKQNGKNGFHFFEESMNADIQKRAELARDLADALLSEQFVLEFQPIVEAATNRIVCVEALVRWKHPRYGMLPPGDFIEIAEASDQMVELGQWVLGEACRCYREWRDAGIAPKRVAVNVSAAQLRQGDLVAAVANALHCSGVSAECLELDITETAMMADEEETARCLGAVRRLGVQIALDDFGTGHSSLSHLKRFPVDSLKIDDAFVGELAENLDAQAITRATISLAHEMGLRVVGEGVESSQQQRFLVKHGCDELQGFRFSVPRNEKEVRLLLERGIIEPGKSYSADSAGSD